MIKSMHSGLFYLVWILTSLLAFSNLSAQVPFYEQAFSAYQEKNFEQAEKTWHELSELGDPNAQYALGVMHQRGEASSASAEQAFQWFKSAAEQQHTAAMFNVGVAYWEAEGAAQNKTEALNWWKKAAELGDSGAQFNLGLAYYIGEEIDTDQELSVKWLGQAAQQNHSGARKALEVIGQERPDLVKQVDPTLIATTGSSKQPDVSPLPPVSTEETPDQPVTTVNQGSAETSTAGENQTFEYWKTTAPTSALFTSANTQAAVITELPSGTPIEVILNNGQWSFITLPEGLKLWIYRNYIDVDTGVVNANGVRARPLPSTDPSSSPPIGQYNKGDKLKVLGESDNWVKVRAPKRLGAWIQTENLTRYRDTRENRARERQIMSAKGV